MPTDASLALLLRPVVEKRDWDELIGVLNTLSNAKFRMAGDMLGTTLSESLGESDFWALFTALVQYNARAFLVTMLKQTMRRIQANNLSLQSPQAIEALQGLSGNAIDVQKTLQHLLPLMETPTQVEELFQHMGVSDHKQRIAALLPCATIPAAYVLFRTLKYEEHDTTLLVRSTYFLMKRADNLGFNLSSLLKCFFGLDQVKGTFSLRLQPYELSRLENSYEAFVLAMES